MKIEHIAFQAGSSADADPLSISPGKMTIFIGPNNGGKSRALAEIQQALIPITGYVKKVISLAIRSDIDDTELQFKIDKMKRPKIAGENPSENSVAIQARGGRTLLDTNYLKNRINDKNDASTLQYVGNLLQSFFLNLDGSSRLSLANSVQAEPLGTPPNNTISKLFGDNELRARISEIIYKGFNQYLVVDPTQLPQIGYRLSSTPPLGNVEKNLELSSIEFFRHAMPLAEASDGTKAFVDLLTEVMAGDPDIIFVDEPEAFLHPALQFLLGQQIAGNITDDKQVFAATHSSSFLLGCVLSGVDVDIIRLTHRSGAASARHLKADRLKNLMTDPLFRSVNAASALFFESAVVVEGDSDRAFYDEINVRMSRFSKHTLQHALFLNAHNKQTVVNIVRPLRDIGIPAAFILDIDWIKEDGQVWDRYFGAIGAPAGLKDGFSNMRRSVRESLSAADSNYKRNGGVDLLHGDERLTADAFFDQLEKYGLFTVRRGELESWLPQLAVDRSKNRWLESIFHAMGSDPSESSYLKPDTDDVWAFLGRIAGWVNDANRRGMPV